MNFYGEICKIEPQNDGTIKVYGYASTGEIDSQGEVVTPEAMKAALPDYMAFGAVREMHQPSAAGTAIEAHVQEDGRTWFGAHVVDPLAVKKVQTGTYKGFSIGGKVIARAVDNPATITEIRLTEVSLVDRPANPEAIFTMFKAEGADMNAKPQAKTCDPVDVAAVLSTLEGQLSATTGNDAPHQEQRAALRAAIAAVKLFATLTPDEPEEPDEDEEADDPVARAAVHGGLAKPDARPSKADQAHLDTIHKALIGLGYRCHAAEAETAGETGKMAGGLEALRKSLDLAAAGMSKLRDERADLTKRLRALEAQPKPAKGATKVMTKAADGRQAENALDDLKSRLDGMTPDQQAREIIKFQMTHSGRAYLG